MKRALTKSLFLFLLPFILGGCNELTQIATPTCSDEATLTLVRQIISENVVEASDQLSPEELKRRLTFSLVHATKLEENIHKYTCEASLTASNGTAEHKISLEYESQLDDARDHLVQVLNLTNGDAFAMKPILMADKPTPALSPSANPVAAPIASIAPEALQSESELNAAAEDAVTSSVTESKTAEKYIDARKNLLTRGFVVSQRNDYESEVLGDKAMCAANIPACNVQWTNANTQTTVCIRVVIDELDEEADEVSSVDNGPCPQ